MTEKEGLNVFQSFENLRLELSIYKKENEDLKKKIEILKSQVKYYPTVHCWILNNGIETKTFLVVKEACDFLGIGKSSFKRHYISGRPTKTGWTIDKGEIDRTAV